MRLALQFCLVFLMFVACVPQKDVVYVQGDADDKYMDIEHSSPDEKTTIEPYDEIYIEIFSLDQDEVNFLNRRQGITNTAGPEGFSLIAHRVDEFGRINLPVIGKIKLSGYTLDEASDLLETELAGYLNSPSVKLNFVNKNIAVMGYVARPGRYYYSTDKISIFQALSMAGDIQEFGNRKNVCVIRNVEDKITKQYINLTNEELFTSPYYYLRSNDIVYVEPLKRRWWGLDTFPYALVLSSITTFILVLDYVNRQ